MNEFKGTKPPWAWQKFGNTYMLTAQHGLREIILGSIDVGNNGDGYPNPVIAMNIDGVLVEVDPNHPNSILMAASPDMLNSLQEAAKSISLMKGCLYKLTDDTRELEDILENWKARNQEVINKALGQTK